MQDTETEREGEKEGGSEREIEKREGERQRASERENVCECVRHRETDRETNR